MFYVDTNILISFIFANEKRHQQVVNELNKLKSQKFHISSLTLLELTYVSAYLFKNKGLMLVNPLQAIISKFSRQDQLKFLFGFVISFLESSLNIEIHGDDEVPGLIENFRTLDTIELDSKESKVLQIISKIKEYLITREMFIEYADFIHILYADALSRKYQIKSILTSDKILKNHESKIKNEFNLSVTFIS